MRQILSDPFVVSHAVIDGINRYVREVLIPRGYVDADSYYSDDSRHSFKYQIAQDVAESWKVSFQNEDECHSKEPN